jgi:autotransporter-associated beta strand protein
MAAYVPFTLNGGTLKMVKGFQQLGGVLTLNGGTLATGPGQGPLYQAFALSGSVAVTGAVPSEIRAEAGLDNGVHLAFNAAAGNLRTFRVDDVTGSEAADLTVTAGLLDSSHTANSAGLVKTGAGTLLLAGGTNTYHGATLVSNGTLLVSNGGISNSAVTVSADAAFGSADATLSRVASLTLAEEARLVWTYDGNAGAAGRIAVTGTLTLPASLTLAVSGSGFLYSGQALFSAGAFAGATDLSGWTITGIPYSAQVVRVGNELLLQVNRGTMLRLR